MKFKRFTKEGVEEYDVTIVGGSFPDNIREKIVDHNVQRITGEVIVTGDTRPKKYDIIIDEDESLVVVWTDAGEMMGAYHVQFAAWPCEWRQYIAG